MPLHWYASGSGCVTSTIYYFCVTNVMDDEQYFFKRSVFSHKVHDSSEGFTIRLISVEAIMYQHQVLTDLCVSVQIG